MGPQPGIWAWMRQKSFRREFKSLWPHMAKLVLFDVDDTLIKGEMDGRNTRWNEMLWEVFGVKVSINLKRFIGMTETETMNAVCSEAGIDKADIERKMRQASRVLTEKYSTLSFAVLPGVRELLETLSESDEIKFGLLTGNTEERAWMKLEKVGLRGLFSFGAFTEDADSRESLFPAALEKAEKLFGLSFSPEDVWVVGDAPRDIGVAVKSGARSIAVMTGPSSERELVAAGADYVLKDFSDYKKVVRIILGRE